MKLESIVPIILCGGTGSRLWPLSRRSFPKQFLNIENYNNKTLFQNTCERLLSLEQLDQPIIICNQEHRFIVAEQMRKTGIKPKSILLEPIGKGTCAAVAIASLKAVEHDENPYLIVMSSDHAIKNNKKFIEAIKEGLKYAEKGQLVTFGIKPTSPETGYGYIEFIENLEKKFIGSQIKRFIEKPNLKKAKELLKNKNILWNSGIFLFRANDILKELQNLEPDILSYCKKALCKSKLDLDFQRVDEDFFAKCTNISIDNAVMEKTNSGTVIPMDCNWRDLGSWDQVWENSEKDLNGNAIQGNVFLENSKNCLLMSEDRLLVGVNIKDLVVIETIDAILVLEKSDSQNIKEILQKLKNKNIKESTEHRKKFRPWGSYTTLVEDLLWKVKKIVVYPNQSLSLQSHKHRSEHWIVVNGTAKIEIDNNIYLLEKNQSAFIPKESKHRLSNPNNAPLTLIEVQNGNYLEEDDIIRFEDDYGRELKQ